MSAVDRAVQLVSRAYGYGQAIDVPLDCYTVPAARWTPANRRTGDGDELNPAASSGLTVVRQSETVMRASAALNPKDQRQRQLLAKATESQREDAASWGEANNLRVRGRAVPNRVGEFETWQQTKGVAVVPRSRPVERVLIGLADAGFTGPLEHVLLLVATQRAEFWPRVRMHAIACGHPAWACDDAGLSLMFGNHRKKRNWNATHNSEPSRRIRDRAKALGMRAEDYREGVGAAVARLSEWLDRAALLLLAMIAQESNVTPNAGEGTALIPDSLWHPERYGLDACGRSLRRESKLPTKGRNR